MAAVLNSNTVAPPISSTMRAVLLGANAHVATATKMFANHYPMTNAHATMISCRCMATIRSVRSDIALLPMLILHGKPPERRPLSFRGILVPAQGFDSAYKTLLYAL